MKFKTYSSLLIFILSLSNNAFAASVPFSWCDEGREWTSGTANIEAQGPDYVLTNSSRQFAGDTNWTASFEDIDFYSDNNFVATDKANIEGNAYKHITLTSRGLSHISAVLSTACSYKKVWVHNSPTISSSSLSGVKLYLQQSLVALMNIQKQQEKELGQL
ncbi:hypothetical protein [Thalassotalea piscium]|uniref:Uncharacterized protein n=1 Tax=Thalassotalea piscium TaxID=1230533 RepID=A0A7X0TS10_9GAMM|nr:hypothetical protein [Thalassotalea piscium]MBB6541663.1 hypothetical protein [Thalassotalea piscium]